MSSPNILKRSSCFVERTFESQLKLRAGGCLASSQVATWRCQVDGVRRARIISELGLPIVSGLVKRFQLETFQYEDRKPPQDTWRQLDSHAEFDGSTLEKPQESDLRMRVIDRWTEVWHICGMTSHTRWFTELIEMLSKNKQTRKQTEVVNKDNRL